MAKYNAVAPFETFIFIPLDIIGQLFDYFYRRLTSRLLYFANFADSWLFSGSWNFNDHVGFPDRDLEGPGGNFRREIRKHPVLCLRLENGSNIRTQLTGNNLLFTYQ